MYVNINQSRTDDHPAGVERFISLASQLAGRRNLSDAAAFKQQIVLALNMLRGIDEKAVAN
jgi:hypothetical protein